MEYVYYLILIHIYETALYQHHVESAWLAHRQNHRLQKIKDLKNLCQSDR